jgi:hypothetical protein
VPHQRSRFQKTQLAPIRLGDEERIKVGEKGILSDQVANRLLRFHQGFGVVQKPVLGEP